MDTHSAEQSQRGSQVVWPPLASPRPAASSEPPKVTPKGREGSMETPPPCRRQREGGRGGESLAEGRGLAAGASQASENLVKTSKDKETSWNSE